MKANNMTREQVSRAGRSFGLPGLLLATLVTFAGPAEPAFDLNDYLEKVFTAQSRLSGAGGPRVAISPNERFAVLEIRAPRGHYLDYLIGINRRLLVLLDLKSWDMRELTRPEEDAHGAVFSPDGKRIAFYARAAGESRLELMDMEGKQRKTVTRISGVSRNPLGERGVVLWSDDGSKLGFTTQPRPSWIEGYIKQYSTAPSDMKEPMVFDMRTGMPHLLVLGADLDMAVSYREFWVVDPDLADPVRALSFLAAGDKPMSFHWQDGKGTLVLRRGEQILTIQLPGIQLPGGENTTRSLLSLPGKPILFQRLSAGRYLTVLEKEAHWMTGSTEVAGGNARFREWARGPRPDSFRPVNHDCHDLSEKSPHRL